MSSWWTLAATVPRMSIVYRLTRAGSGSAVRKRLDGPVPSIRMNPTSSPTAEDPRVTGTAKAASLRPPLAVMIDDMPGWRCWSAWVSGRYPGSVIGGSGPSGAYADSGMPVRSVRTAPSLKKSEPSTICLSLATSPASPGVRAKPAVSARSSSPVSAAPK